MSKIPDITDAEQWTVQRAVDERWGKGTVELQLADVEARLDKGDHELTDCPAIYWEQGECHFVILKTTEKHYRTLFYYGNREQFGTSIPEYDELGDCDLSLLSLQSDHERNRAELKAA